MARRDPGAPDALGGRRPGVGRSSRPSSSARSSSSATPDPYLETALSLPARHRAVLPSTATTASTLDRARPVRARDLQPLPAADAAGQADARDRAAADVGPRHRHRDAHEPGHRHRSTRPTRSCATSTSRPSTSARRRSSSCRPGRGRSSRARRARRCSTPGALDGPPAAVLAFEPRRSDLPLQVAFPVLLANLAGELMGGSDDAGRRGRPRRARSRCRSPRARPGVRVERPDGSVDELVAPTRGRRERHVRADRPAGRLHGHAASRTRTRRPPRPAGRRRVVGRRRVRAVRRAAALARRVADLPAARARTRRPGSRSTCSTSTSRGSRPATRRALTALGTSAAGPGAAAGGAAASSARTPATSCGSRSCSSRSRPADASSGWSTSATRSRACAGPSRRGSAGRRADAGRSA